MAESLTLERLCKTYRTRGREPFDAVKGIDLAIEAGELVALLGPSGCGKTTTLRMIAGLETVTSGDIRVGDRSIPDIPPGKRNLGVGFESYALYPPLNVRENLAYGLKARKVKNSREIVDRLCERLEMSELLSLRPAALSSGQKQRVALARALVRNPPVLLLDEPLSHLDAAQRQRVRRELKKLQREFGYTTIVVTHDQLEALSLADRMAVMDAGIIQQFGTPDEIFDDPANIFVADFVGEPKINLLEGRIEDHAVRLGPDSALTVSPRIEDGRAVVVGIRPQDVQVCAESDPYRIAAKVRVFENLLEFGLGTLDVAGIEGPVVAQTLPGSDWKTADAVHLTAPAERIYLFDPDTGLRLR